MSEEFNRVQFRILLIAIRQALIIALGAIEDFLCLKRSIVPKHERGKECEEQ
jgi:hypothetical protein